VIFPYGDWRALANRWKIVGIDPRPGGTANVGASILLVYCGIALYRWKRAWSHINGALGSNENSAIESGENSNIGAARYGVLWRL
jgi:hypothetical protein